MSGVDSVSSPAGASGRSASARVSVASSTRVGFSAWIDSTDSFTGQGHVHRVASFAGGVNKNLGASLAELATRINGQLVGFDVDGQQRWSAPVRPSTRFRVGPVVVLIQDDDRWITALDAETGALRWTADPGSSANVASDAVAAYWSTDLAIHAVDLDTGADRWSITTGASGLIASPAGLLARTGRSWRVIRLDPATGALADWPIVANRKELTWSDFRFADEHAAVLQQTEDPRFVSVYDTQSGSKRWSLAAHASVVVADAELVAVLHPSADDRAYLSVYDIDDGRLLAEFADVITEPAVRGRDVYLGVADTTARRVDLRVAHL